MIIDDPQLKPPRRCRDLSACIHACPISTRCQAERLPNGPTRNAGDDHMRRLGPDKVVWINFVRVVR